MGRYDGLLNILKEQVVPAIGCTEPIAVALAGAVSRRHNDGKSVSRVNVKVSENVFKNGMGVGIPGAGGRKGLNMAVALGVCGGNPELGLEVLKEIKEEDLVRAEELVRKDVIDVAYKPEQRGVYVEVELETEKGVSRVIIEQEHSKITFIEFNKQVIKDERQEREIACVSSEDIARFHFKDFLEMVENIQLSEIEFINDGIIMNKAIAEAGLKRKLGMGLSHGIRELIKNRILNDDLCSRVKLYTTAASDARMSGAPLPVMSSAGSGNHGLTAILPVAITGEYLKKSREEIIRAVTLSHLVTNYIKKFTGRLSAICGCSVAAGSGAAAGIAWLLGCNKKQIEGAVKNIIGNLSGMICDGAKNGCSLKLGVSAGEAVLAAQLAKHNYIIPDSDGIVGLTLEETVQNLGKVSDPGMVQTDSMILQVMINKNKKCFSRG